MLLPRWCVVVSLSLWWTLSLMVAADPHQPSNSYDMQKPCKQLNQQCSRSKDCCSECCHGGICCTKSPHCISNNPCLHKVCGSGTYCMVTDPTCGRKHCTPRAVCIIPPTCEHKDCPNNTHCEMRMPPCTERASCYKMPNCIDDNPCARKPCGRGYICKMVYNRPTCVPVDPCSLKKCPKHTHCVLTNARRGCKPIPECVQDDVQTCAAISCVKGTDCQVNNGVAKCVANGCAGSNCPPGTHCVLEYPVCSSLSTSPSKPVKKCPPVARCIANENPCMYAKCSSGICNVIASDTCDGQSCESSPVASCSPVPLGPCEKQYCPSGSHCEKVDTHCTQIIGGSQVSVLCNAMGTCVADYDPCATVKCISGYVCQTKNIVCKKAPCIPPTECVPIKCKGIECPLGTCVLVYPPCAPPSSDELINRPACEPLPICTETPSQDPCSLVECPWGTVCQIKKRICFPPCHDETECVPIECKDHTCPVGSHCTLRRNNCDDSTAVAISRGNCVQMYSPYCEPNPNPCDQCGPGTSCQVTNVVCVMAPCLPVVECIPYDPCNCKPGWRCEVAYPKCPPTPGQALPEWCQGPTYTCVPADDLCTQCGPFTTCKVTQIMCFTTPCDPIVECLPNDPCANAVCHPNFCQPKEIFSIPYQPPVAECVPELCLSLSCPLGYHCETYTDQNYQLVPTCVADSEPCSRCGEGMTCVPTGNMVCSDSGPCLPSIQCVPKPCSEIRCPPGLVCRAPGIPCEVPCVEKTGCYSRLIIG